MIKNVVQRLTKNVCAKNLKKFQSLKDTSNLTEEQKEIYDMALDFSKTKIIPFASEWDQKHHFPKDVIKEAAQLGFGSIYTKSEFGGCELQRMDASLIFEGLATGCVATSAYISIHNMNSWVIDTYADQKLKEKYLTQMNTMDLFSSYCLTEPNSGSDAGSMVTSARKDGTDYILSGSKVFISNACNSDVFIVMCRTGPKEISTLVVEKGMKGLSFGKIEEKMGWRSSHTSVVNFDEVRVPAENLVGKEGIGFKIAMSALDGGRINIASTSLGAATHCLEQAKDHLNTRKQFGKTLSQFQHLQFKIAELASQLVASRLMIRNAARMMDINHPEKTMYAAMAKQYGTDNCFEVVNGSLQMFGGYGYLCEYQIERYLRDIRVNQILEGTNEIMKLIVSRRLLKEE